MYWHVCHFVQLLSCTYSTLRIEVVSEYHCSWNRRNINPEHFQPVPWKLGMQPHPLAKMFWAKLIGFGQIWLDFSKIEEELRRNLGKSDKIWI